MSSLCLITLNNQSTGKIIKKDIKKIFINHKICKNPCFRHEKMPFQVRSSGDFFIFRAKNQYDCCTCKLNANHLFYSNIRVINRGC